jgi:hypothetical protein
MGAKTVYSVFPEYSQIRLISYCLFCDIAASSTAECENTSNALPSDTGVEGVEPFFNFERDFMYGAPGWGHEATKWHGQWTTFWRTVHPCIAVNLPPLEAARDHSGVGRHQLFPGHL